MPAHFPYYTLDDIFTNLKKQRDMHDLPPQSMDPQLIPCVKLLVRVVLYLLGAQHSVQSQKVLFTHHSSRQKRVVARHPRPKERGGNHWSCPMIHPNPQLFHKHTPPTRPVAFHAFAIHLARHLIIVLSWRDTFGFGLGLVWLPKFLAK